MLFSKKNKLLFIFLFFVESLFSQNLPSENISTVDGLPNNSIHSIFKDSRGILWVGTANGLAAIKNKTIQNFYTTDGLAHNSCWAIQEDQNRNLWFGSYGGGLTFYDGKKFKIINSLKGLVNDKIRTLFIHEKYLYVGTQYGFSVIDIASHRVLFSGKIKGLKDLFQVMDFYVQDGKVYFATFNDGVWSIDLSRRKMKLENHEIPHVFSLYSNYSKLYISHIDIKRDYLNQFTIKDNKNNLLERFSSKSIYWDYIKDKRGTIYAAGDGINLANGGVFELTKNGFVNKNANFRIESFSIYSLNYDPQLDLLYVGTLDKGLYVIDLKGHLAHYSSSDFNKSKLEIVKILNVDGFELVLSSEELLFIKQNSVNSSITKRKLYDFMHKLKGKWTSRWNRFYKNVPFEEFEFKDLKLFDSKIWLSTNLGLFEISRTMEIKSYLPFHMKDFYFNKSQLIFQQPYGKIFVLDNFPKDSSFVYLDGKGIDSVRDIVQIIDLSDRQILLSSSLGLFSYQNGKFSSYLSNGTWNERELVYGVLNANNNLAVGNAKGDIFILDLSDKFKIIKQISAKTLLGGSISFIESYKEYWVIGNEKGIVLYKEGQVRLIDEDQGLTNKIITSANVEGNLLRIGTLTGYYKLDLEKYLSTKILEPQLNVSSIEVNFQMLPNGSFKWFNYNTSKLDLPYFKNTVFISFEPHQVSYPSKLVYSYKLLGIENTNWSKWSNSKIIYLTYLPVGNYKVQVKIKDLHQGIITEIELLTINIYPPFWNTWWFILMTSVAIFIVAYFAFKKRVAFITRREQEKGEIQKRLSETKMEALQSQMNPHFIFNAMNSIQNFILGNNIDEALKYMGEFSKLIRQTLNNSSRIRISLKEEINYLKSYTALENLRNNNAIDVQIIIDEDIESSEIEIPPMLIQPFVENAFVHAFNSKSLSPKLIIDFRLQNDFLLCSIADNGKGMDESKTKKLHQSKGIQLVKERLSLLQPNSNHDVDLFSNPNQGTTILIRILIRSV